MMPPFGAVAVRLPKFVEYRKSATIAMRDGELVIREAKAITAPSSVVR